MVCVEWRLPHLALECVSIPHLSPAPCHCGVQAYAAARMAESCLLGLQGKDNIYECAYVQSTVVPGLDFFASKVCRYIIYWTLCKRDQKYCFRILVARVQVT